MVEDKAAGKPALHYYSVAATCLFLATKVEENCRKMKELVVACVRVAQKAPAKVVDEQDKEYWRWRDTILQMEDLLLEAVCFDLSLEPPYKTLYEMLCFLGEGSNKRLRNAAWAFVNDSCLTMLCLQFPSRTIAAAALYAAARHCDVRFRDDEGGRPWWEVCGVELRAVRQACNYMASVYENTPLKNGGDGGGSIYERTPEEGDEWVAKTRERREEDGQSGERGSEAGSELSRKRGREDEADDIPWGGDFGEEREEKKARLEGNGLEDRENENAESNGMANGVEGNSYTNGTAIPAISASLADGKEEGEV